MDDFDRADVAEAQRKLEDALNTLKILRPPQGNPVSRHWAVSITEMEKAYAYFYAFVVINDTEMEK